MPAMGILVTAERVRKVAPRDSGAVVIKHRFNEQVFVQRICAKMPGLAGQQIVDATPLIDAQARTPLPLLPGFLIADERGSARVGSS